MKQSIEIQTDKLKYGTDSKGARYIAHSFKFLDGTEGMVIVMRLTKEQWKPIFKKIDIEYENSSREK